MSDEKDKKTYVDEEGNFMTDEHGRTREATDDEIEKTTEKWKKEGEGEKRD